MAALALALFALYLALAFGARVMLQLRRIASSGFNGVGGRPGSVEWFGDALFACALGLGLAVPVLDLVGGADAVGVLDGRPGQLSRPP